MKKYKACIFVTRLEEVEFIGNDELTYAEFAETMDKGQFISIDRCDVDSVYVSTFAFNSVKEYTE